MDARHVHRASQARDLCQSGLRIVSCHQCGTQDTADWLAGQNAGVQHARRGWELHVATGGSFGAPIYTSIDDDRGYERYKAQVAPHLCGWESVLGHHRTGVYANSRTIGWAVQDGLGSYLWQHTWGSPRGLAHPAAHLHRVEIDKRRRRRSRGDVNHIHRPGFGQWGRDLPISNIPSKRFFGGVADG